MLFTTIAVAQCLKGICGPDKPTLKMSCKIAETKRPDVYTLKTIDIQGKHVWKVEPLRSNTQLKVDFGINNGKLRASAYKRGYWLKKSTLATAVPVALNTDDDSLTLSKDLTLQWSQEGVAFTLTCSSSTVFQYNVKTRLTCYQYNTHSRTIDTPLVSVDKPFTHVGSEGTTVFTMVEGKLAIDNTLRPGHEEWNRYFIKSKYENGLLQCYNFQKGDQLPDRNINLQCQVSGYDGHQIRRTDVNYGKSDLFRGSYFSVSVDITKFNGYELRFRDNYGRYTDAPFKLVEGNDGKLQLQGPAYQDYYYTAYYWLGYIEYWITVRHRLHCITLNGGNRELGQLQMPELPAGVEIKSYKEAQKYKPTLAEKNKAEQFTPLANFKSQLDESQWNKKRHTKKPEDK